MTDEPRKRPAARHFYGRRKGHPLTHAQQDRLDRLLPTLGLDLAKPAPALLNTLFAEGTREVWLEIGFGAGEHLAWQAEHNPDIGLIGVEPFVNGMAQLCARCEASGLANIRLFDDEAQILLGWLPPQSIARTFILFPDPWPKRRHQKRRIVSPKTLAALARVMVPGAELRIATDIADYVRTTLLAISRSPDFVWPAMTPGDWRVRTADWPATRYETKAIAAGRPCYYFRFNRR